MSCCMHLDTIGNVHWHFSSKGSAGQAAYSMLSVALTTGIKFRGWNPVRAAPHGDHLGEAAWLEDGRHEQNVGAGVDQVAQRLVVRKVQARAIVVLPRQVARQRVELALRGSWHVLFLPPLRRCECAKLPRKLNSKRDDRSRLSGTCCRQGMTRSHELGAQVHALLHHVRRYEQPE